MEAISIFNSPSHYRYGFDYGSAHVVIMSTEHQFTEGTPQYSYLENHLKSVNRKVTPWLIFGGHRYEVFSM